MNAAKGVILAAGRGSRLGGLTSARPKALVKLCGRPLLEWQLRAFGAACVRDITVIGGYRADALSAYSRVVVNERWSETNMVSSLMRYDASDDADIIISYSVYSPRAIRKLAAAKGDVAVLYDLNWLALWGARFADPLDDAESFATVDGAIADIGRKGVTLSEIDGQYMGLVKFSRQGWDACIKPLRELPIAVTDALDMTGFLQRIIAAGRSVAAVPYDDPWCEVDSPRDVAIYETDDRFAELRRMLATLDAAPAPEPSKPRA
jgi:L-glutamine-phosphate cytidylyltransferase